MKRKYIHSFHNDIDKVFNAYLDALKNEPFKKETKTKDNVFISFRLSMSLTYNMNGGTVKIYLSKKDDGSEVEVNYKIYQLIGARCEAYDNLLLDKVKEILNK